VNILATSSKNFRVKNGLDVNGPIGFGVTPDYGTSGKVLSSSGINSVPIWRDAGLISFNQKTASYTLLLSDKDKMVEVSSSSATTITVPANSSEEFPIGSQISIMQTGTGQVTISPVNSGVTINATPGLKLRAQWSSATLIKRAENVWVLVGDLVL
jgi:hypothetical protein